MPGGDGTGPPAEGSRRAGRMGGNRPGAGPGGNCICPACGRKVPHQPGTPCSDMSCPGCGAKMKRE
jgi:hypothetical protein